MFILPIAAVSNRNITEATYIILKFLVSSVKKKKRVKRDM